MPPEDDSPQRQQHQRQLQLYYDETLRSGSAGADHIHMPLIERNDSECSGDDKPSFFQVFRESRAGPQIVLLITLLALGLGSVIGVVPSVMTDRYAHLFHDLPRNVTCSSFRANDKPPACFAASADAQQAVANERLISNALTFFTSSLIGSFSDEYGRKPILVAGLLLSCLSPTILVLIQLHENMSPFYYYAAGAIQVNWFAVALSSLADVLPPQWRAPSFGVLLAGFSCGFALAPRFSLWFGHFYVSVWSLVTLLGGLSVVVFFLPETISEDAKAQALLQRAERPMTWWYRPLWELSILNRNSLFRLLSSLAFFSGMVAAGDQTLLLYYIQERLSFNDKDIANLFLIMGVLGIFVQSVGLKTVIEKAGERNTIMISFALGTIHNLLYGLARNKATIFVAIAIGSGVSMAFPTISAIKANNVKDAEQGRIQGALYSVQAIASGLGPTVMRQIYGLSQDGTSIVWGPGTMFLFSSLFYVVAVYCASQLPEEANASHDLSEEVNESSSEDLVEESSLLL
ncbi:hypothetical protein FisN_40Lh017 [Fistulifera solaris]|uniref:Major facilitator superfamily (MFS) profile domain-containing protein n=1 Tax=Fistulifera solaris TaxID=1519565 RepID=A0A1Z5J979_FISSO|nr:hypothetical protein FisN_40Lh017 [Fistulifera solaris]|eukprot:GAX10547.1 hypothetical protein FisN_40Lh017 [Fistulifera solaris]